MVLTFFAEDKKKEYENNIKKAEQEFKAKNFSNALYFWEASLMFFNTQYCLL